MKAAFDAGKIDLSQWESLGYKSEEAYSQALENAFANYEKKATNLTDGLSETVTNAFNSIDTNKLTLDTKEKIAGIL
jgi:hypothetical protein